MDAAEIPVAPELDALVDQPLEAATTFGEDFELVATLPPEAVDDAREATPVPLSVVGEVVEDGVTLDGEPLADRGWTH